MNTSAKISILLFCLVLGQSLSAQEETRGNLVSAAWLRDNLNNDNLVILDASPTQIYNAKHIPGAVNYDIFIYGVRELPTAEIEKKYQAWGISPGKKIVMYDQGGTMMATRLFFSLNYYGIPVKDLFILDGGLARWQESGFPVTGEPTLVAQKGTFTISNINKDIKAGLPEFLTASGDPENNVLLEALEPDWHYGEKQFFDKPGHIPNAVMLPTGDFFNPDKTFKSADEIGKILAYLGISPEHNIYTTCGGGIAASVPYFVLRYMLNYPNVKLYSGSQLEWVSDQRELPVWTYDAPFMMRESAWLQFWGGKTARMYGISNIAIIDTRPSESYNQGHLPFSLNIPGDIFSANFNNPGKLAEILGSGGVHPDQETVILSGAGLTKDAALAFILLEKLGQQKVSVFIDSISEWQKLGYSVTKDPTVIGQKKSPGDLSIVPTDYSGAIRDGVIINETLSTQGHFPKVYIASGKDIPAKAPEGKVVHVPFTDLLNANGTPRSASDIWKTLSKAGVPRYAELVCYSEDPGEAAVNYYILKLMGFPDVKILVYRGHERLEE